MTDYAHSLENQPIDNWQLLGVHLNNVAKIAAQFAKAFGAESWAKVAGQLHDLGKYSKEFKGYLRHVNGIDDEFTHIYRAYHQHKIDHATAGAQYAVEKFGKQLGQLLAYVIAGHHSGLPNGKDNSNSSLVDRLTKDICTYDTSTLNHYNPIIKQEELPFLPEISGFSISFFIRMLYSCLVDADFLDTEKFMNIENTLDRKCNISLETLQGKLNIKIQSFVPGSSFINGKRAQILSDCLNKAHEAPGLFSLTVPTGGGKTISSLAFALEHAIKYKKTRIIYVIPYTSIIEQTANEFRSILGEKAVLEHHSNFDSDNETRFSKLASQNWDAPIIVTTNVQFFESLFANKSSRCRKLHNIANSVIILDEAQMLPVNLLEPCLATINQLAKNYRVSLVLCTATQPVLTKTDQFTHGLENVREIISNPQTLYKAFKRVNVEVIDGTLSNEKLVDKIEETDQNLCIVSTKKLAREIFEKLDKEHAFHLSTNMCPQHRSEKFSQIRTRLNNNQPCQVVSTQLIEAGVDIDFPRVFRSMAGLDSIAQSAGRCNREGKLKTGELFVFRSEKSTPPGFLRHCADEGEQVIRHHKHAPLSLEATKEYFERLYWRKSSEMDTPNILKSLNDIDRVSKLQFPLKSVAENFKLINSATKAIIIPYTNKGKSLCNEIRQVSKRPPEAQFLDSKTNRQLQRFSVQVHPQIFNNLKASGAIEGLLDDKYWLLINPDIYDKNLGLKPEDPSFYSVDTLMK